MQQCNLDRDWCWQRGKYSTSTAQDVDLEQFHSAHVQAKLPSLQAASPLVAVFQFFLRDLAGMCGGIVFAFAQVLLKHQIVHLC